MALSAIDVTTGLLSYAVVTDKASLVKLLERNGVSMPQNPSDREVTTAVLMASAKSSNFKDELAKFLSTKAKPASQEFASFTGGEFGFTGIDDIAFTGWDNFKNALGDLPRASRPSTLLSTAPVKPAVTIKPVAVPTAALTPKTAATAPKGKTGVGKVLGWLGSNVFTQENVNAGVQIGLTQLNNKSQGKANQIQAQTNELISQQDDIRNNPNLGGKKGMSTMAWVGIGVGVIALVGIIYYFAKKK
jgi:hypothetical protein